MRDPQLSPDPTVGADTKPIKIIGWDYVNNPPVDIPPVADLQATLLEHGPLAVMMLSDQKFLEYGAVKHKLRGNGKLAGKDLINRARFEIEKAGDLFARFPEKIRPVRTE